ncbi:patatin-like phospholipase family protein [Cryomorphaceae bacterium 1068]|nr:patatin-like phospholipase family protein [Cryomorphaceae bacterium 1068]
MKMHNRLRSSITLVIFVLTSCVLQAQKVGLVLSGGGAAGLAHIGVIKALEENNIPIDYITGTSMGALIGGLYASGYSVEEIIQFAKSPEFLLAIEGKLDKKDVYYFTQELYDASIIRIKVNPKNILGASLPTNLVTPNLMEYMFMDIFSGPAAVANYDFDSLMVPFRCVAADITKKEEVVFREGSLSRALRASTTYPFYFQPISVDSTLLYDGGLYNNFPADVMYDEFLPDYVIGSNVASVIDPPTEDDLFSQIRNMISSQTDFSLHCENGVLILPPSELGVFDFASIDEQIESGYLSALAQVDEILENTESRRTIEDLDSLRALFNSQIPEKNISTIDILGELTANQKTYISSTLGPEKYDYAYTFSDFKPQFLRLAQDGKIKNTQPYATYYESEDAYNVALRIRQEKDLKLYFGGNFSSRPVNFGYVGVKYNLFGRSSTSIMANSYFGKFYGSVLLRANIDFGGKKRFSFAPHVVLNRWDYFRSFATFFELSRPSFIVKSETYGGIDFIASLGNNTILTADFDYGETEDRYYQTEDFTVADTSDVTNFTLGTIGVGIDRNTLNRKVYPNSGTRLQISVRGVVGEELTEYGSTTVLEESFQFKDDHKWFEAKLKYQNYFANLGPVTFGFDAEALYSNKPFFENYNASLISAPAYTPIPESKTIFLDEFRTTEYVALGLKSIIELRKNFEVRIEGYAFQPGQEIIRNGSNDAEFTEPFEDRYFIGASALVFHSPLGPVSLNLNYYDSRDEGPWSFFFNFGYTIFNKSVYEL